MAFSCVKVQFEFGHEATLKNKRSPEGFTHDWEVFVRGADNSDISHFVDRVVFHLHDTFPKPKRVVKEPPFVVKESGYAGFELPIDIYFKNQNDPKKFQFKYDLTLQSQTGQRGPISKVLREKYVFNNPTEDLRRRLIRGGGVGVTGSSLEKLALAEEVPSAKQAAGPLVSKPKLGGDISKKQKVKDYKVDEPSRANDHFTDLFGTPIHTTRASPETKKASVASTKNIEKVNNDKLSSGGKSSKHIPHKENSAKDERRKDRDKSKEKTTKRSSSPPKRPASPSKHVQSPKRSITPSKKASPKRPVTPTLKEENKKSSDDLRGKTDVKSADGKTEKKKKDKKSKDDKNKKDRKSSDKKDVLERIERAKELKDKEKKLPKEHAISIGKEPEKIKAKHSDVEKDKEKQKHKHKKKDKNKQEDSNTSGKDKKKDKIRPSKKDSEKINDVSDKDQNGFEKESSRSSSHSSTNKKTDRNDSPSPVRPKASPTKRAVTPDKPSTSKEKPAKRPIKLLLEQLSDREESSNSTNSSEDEDTQPPPKKLSKSSEATSISSAAKTSQSIENVVNSYGYSPPNNKVSPSKPKAPFQESSSTNQNGKQRDKSDMRTKKNGDEEGEKSGNKDEGTDGKSLKRKRSSGKEAKSKNKPQEKMSKEMPDATSETVKVADEVPAVRNEKQTLVVKGVPRPIDLLKPHMVDGKFTADYVDQLKNLQHKIMTLDDNEELQRVVQVIAETGQYEITPKTFDFDLCTLDVVTVKRLQDFFTAS